jgi:hypothetical protein
MKRIALFLFLVLSAVACFAQTQIDPTYQIQWNLLSGSGAPLITCTQNGDYTVYPYGAQWGQSYQDKTNNVEYKCTASGWVQNATQAALNAVQTTANAALPANGLTTSPGGNISGAGTATFGNLAATITSTAPNISVSVLEYGAVGNGSTDDTAAIQAALNSKTNNLTVHGVGKSYRTTAPIYIRGNSKILDFDGGQLVYDITSVAKFTITAYSSGSNVFTLTGSNSLTAGQYVVFSVSVGPTVLNGLTLPVLSTGLSSSQFEVAYTGASGSGSVTGTASTISAALIIDNPNATPASTAGAPTYYQGAKNVSIYAINSTPLIANTAGILVEDGSYNVDTENVYLQGFGSQSSSGYCMAIFGGPNGSNGGVNDSPYYGYYKNFSAYGCYKGLFVGTTSGPALASAQLLTTQKFENPTVRASVNHGYHIYYAQNITLDAPDAESNGGANMRWENSGNIFCFGGFIEGGHPNIDPVNILANFNNVNLCNVYPANGDPGTTASTYGQNPAIGLQGNMIQLNRIGSTQVLMNNGDIIPNIQPGTFEVYSLVSGDYGRFTIANNSVILAESTSSSLFSTIQGNASTINVYWDATNSYYAVQNNSTGGYFRLYQKYGSPNAGTALASMYMPNLMAPPANLAASGNGGVTGTLPVSKVGFNAWSTWTPTDQSGGSLTFSSSGLSCTQTGHTEFCQGYIQYPSTSDSHNAKIGGLPVQPVYNTGVMAIGSSPSIAAGSPGIQALGSTNNAAFYTLNGGVNLTNANLSGVTLYLAFFYQTN